MKHVKRWLCAVLAFVVIATSCLSDAGLTMVYASNLSTNMQASGNSSAQPDSNNPSSSEEQVEEEGISVEASVEEYNQGASIEETEDRYENYMYGDPDYSGNYVYGLDENGNEILEYYENDLDTIISMAEDGMNLENFFRGSIFSGFTLENLHSMRDEGYSFNEILSLYLSGTDQIPDWMGEALYMNGTGYMVSLLNESGLPNTLTGQNWQPMSQYALEVIQCLGGSKRHGKIGKLKALGDDGMSYEVFCLSYGGSYQGGYIYNRAEYSSCNAPNGAALTNDQKEMLKVVVNCYLNMTNQFSFDYSAAQLIMWYIINNVQSYGQLDRAQMVSDLATVQRAINGDAPQAQAYLNTFILGICQMVERYRSEGDAAFGGNVVEVFFWKSGSAPNAQNILSWSGDSLTFDGGIIPYINNSYMERTATTRYNVDVTKESIITNELLEGVQLEVVESEASGHDLTYDFITGEYAQEGTDYEDATILPDSFGNVKVEADPVPYMDADVQPSGGQHRTIITTDEKGHASTTFVHTHTFKEFYSTIYALEGEEIDKNTYQKMWDKVLEKAAVEGSLLVMYKGQRQTMTLAELQEIYDNQQVVYTQTQEEAENTINSKYDAYCARTYTYTVTELDTYTRPASTDSNGNTLSEIRLPKDGYRKDVKDATTVGSYVEVVKNGGTMIAGGTNDADANTEERNVTNEPWYNQIFINKTDLETNSQILYDTAFDIYEYYQYKVNLSPAKQKVYPAKLLTGYMSELGSVFKPESIKTAKLVITNSSDTVVSEQDIDVSRMVQALSDPESYYLEFSTTLSGSYKAALKLTLDDSLDLSGAIEKHVYDGTLVSLGSCTCTGECGENCEDTCPVCSIDSSYCTLFEDPVTVYKLHAAEDVEKEITSWDNDAGTLTTTDGITYTVSWDADYTVGTYTYTDENGDHVLTTTDNAVGVNEETNEEGATIRYTLNYVDDVDTGIYVFGDGTKMRGFDLNHKYVSIEEGASEGEYVLYFYASGTLENGVYTYQEPFSVAASGINKISIDRNVNTDPDDYTTWGQANYEIVRVTPEIARSMGWSDTTIGMYTVHRLSPTDQYCGTTFTNHHDESDKNTEYGYYEYGTLYYTQANQGKFAIVERTAPADSSRTGYLGNYEDRDYTKLSEQSEKKNNDGSPYSTSDQMSTVKMVHYVDLCTDTNQYATYMLTDGYKEYDSEYYTRYVEAVKDDRGNDVATEDGYDAHYYDQSSLKETIALERYHLENPVNDILNSYWDNWFSEYLSRASGLNVVRNSQKTDAWMNELLQTDIVHHYVGTTINKDSFDDNDAAQSDITYDGTYTNTNINYNSYAGDRAEALNGRHGFNTTEYLQVGNVTYDNGAAEKQARYFNTAESVNKEEGFAFIDEREYGFIRFTKYDMDAERYVTGDLDEGYEAGTDHADADLDGAVYSLYVDETNTFDVDYLEGTLNGKLFWAQPLKEGGYRIIWDADENADNGFTDLGSNTYEDYPHAYVTEDQVLHLDYYDEAAGEVQTEKKTSVYNGIQHPDGQYGGEKHNGFYAVLNEQQVFLDLNDDGYADTWTLQDVTLYAGAKVASAVIEDGELQIDGLYLGTYYLAEEIRDAITIYSTDNDDVEFAENRWLSFAPGYTADTDDSGNPVKYYFYFPYTGKEQDGNGYDAEQDYVHKDTSQVSNQQVVRGGSAQFNKVTSNGESSSSGNTTQEALEGAGFKVYLLSELSLIVDGTIAPAYSEVDGHELVEQNALTKLFDAAGNMVGYEFTRSYMRDNGIYEYFDEKYPDGYNLSDVNRLVYVKNRGYYYIEDILDAYRNQYYDNYTKKWDFSGEDRAIARIYENDTDYITQINADYDYVENHLNSGSPCEYYGVNGLSDGWVPTGVKNEYKLSEIFTNHYGNLRVPELSWGAYIMVETTTPQDVFTADPVFFTITDSSASLNRSKKVAISDAPFVASLVLVKRDAQSGQDILRAKTRYRIWDYTNNRYITKYLYGENGGLSMVAQRVFETDEEGRVNAVASLELGKYRIEELSAPNGTHNLYWDYGNGTEGELLGGIGTDSDVPTEDNMFQKYYGTVDFEVTTNRLYKSSGIVNSDNLDYIYIGEVYYNDEIQGKLTISKTGEVLVGYENTKDIEYADEYTDHEASDFNYSKSMMRDRSVFESMKDHYDLGTDEITTRDITIDNLSVTEIIPVEYIAYDAAGMGIAALYTNSEGNLITMNGGLAYRTGVKLTLADGTVKMLPGALVTTNPSLFVYEKDGAYVPVTSLEVEEEGVMVTKYYLLSSEEVTDSSVIDALVSGAELTLTDGTKEYVPEAEATEISAGDGYLMIVYEKTTDIYEQAEVKEAENTYIYTVEGSIMDTSYLVTDTNGILMTNDYGTLTANGDGTYTLTYTEAIYDPDINYNYTLTLADGSTKAVKLITTGLYLSVDNELVKELADGGYSITGEDGTVTKDATATLSLAEENTGETFDFVYEERPLAGATYVIKAAEDIMTQDGGDNYWFKKGDVVATVTTGNDGEIVEFAPAYNRGGTYNATYYYGNSNGSYNALTKEDSYTASEFATTGSVKNEWIASRMSSLDLSLFGIPAFTDDTIYPNTYYREDVQPIYRRFTKESVSSDVMVTDYQSRLEAEGGLSSEGCKILTKTADGFMLTNKESIEYENAVLTENADYFLLKGKGRSGEDIEIEVRVSEDLFEITQSLTASQPFVAGDYVSRTASGYKIVHTAVSEKGVDNGALVDGAADLGYTTVVYYPNGSLTDNGDGTYTLYDENQQEIAVVKGGLLVTEAGGIVTQTANGYRVDYEVSEEITANQYVTPSLSVKEATLVIKDQEYELAWDSTSQSFKTTNGTEVTFAPDYETVIVTTDGVPMSYRAFDLLVEYEFHYAQKEDIVRVEKDGTLGMVSIYLPLGSYTIEETKTPYGFLISDQVQTVQFSAADQIKEVVFNTRASSSEYTQKTMNIWESKGLKWFMGGLNTIGEKLNQITNVNFFTWGTYGDAEEPFYQDKNAFVNFFDLRVKAWSQEEVPSPTNDKVTISKRDITTLAELPGASLTLTDESGTVVESWISSDKPHVICGLTDGTYVLTEVSAPDGYDTAESITFTVEDGKVASGTIVMYDAPTDKSITISKQNITNKRELPGAQLVLTDASGTAVDSWTSGRQPHVIENLADGKYTLTEITAPDNFTKSESVTFTVKDGVAFAGDVVMYDAPDNGKSYFSKQDLVTKEELPGAKLVITDANGKTVDSWTSTDEPHVIAVMEDGEYVLTEITAPSGYEKAESITFRVVDGVVVGGPVVMYDRPETAPEEPEDDRHEEPEDHQWKLGVGIYKADSETEESLRGAKFGLYTSDDIYNVDGKLIVPKDTLLAVATTDETGHANFAVDIALMSKDLDAERAEHDLVYGKTICYTYDSLTQVTGDVYLLSAEGADEVLVSKQADGTYKTESGSILSINEAEKTVTYMVNESIDGNTAVNTGKFHIKELTPPDGYLYDDTVYDVEFVYDDEYTMYIPVYAKHKNEPTKVTLNKMDLTGQEEVPGAQIAVYKIKDVNDKDADGLISHEDDNLILVDSWESTLTPHETTGLLLSNTQWPRLSNQEVRENIYIFREVIPADGYVRATDIEFKLYQIEGEEGWINPDTEKPYGYEVLARMNTCDQQYESGSIISPDEHADSWILNGTAQESDWDYTRVLDGKTEVKWLLVNRNLVLYFEKDTNKETIDKVLKEEDFAQLDFDTVYLEFGGDAFAVDFYVAKQVADRPADSYLHYDQMWYKLNDMHFTMYDDTTKLVFTKQDIVTGEDVIGAKLEIRDSEGNLMDSWTTEADEEGNAVPHYIEGVLSVDTDYTLIETLAPGSDGYVKSNSIQFRVDDNGHIQHVVMQDDFTKLEISKADITTGKEVDGAMLEIWTADANGNKGRRVESWTTGQDGYDAQGNPNRHYIDYLAPGKYLLVETMAPEGYLLAEDVPFTITETGLLQKVQMFDATTSLKIYKYRTGTTTFVPGATIRIYEVPEEYVQYLTDRIEVETDAGFVDSSTDTDFRENTEIKESQDLLAYLTGVHADNTEHRDVYETELRLNYSIRKEDMTGSLTFTHHLPSAIKLDEDELDTEFVVRDEGDDAFTYVFGKDVDGYTITVTFDADYLAAKDFDTYNFYLKMNVIIDDSAVRANGRISVTFADGVILNIAKESITEVDSSLKEPAVTIRLTEEDLRATVRTTNKPSTVQGLTSGWYIALETAAPSGYILDKTPQVFHLDMTTTEQALTFYNQLKPGKPSSGGGGSTPSKPTGEIGKLILKFGNGWKWNNVRTEDNGEEGSSIILTIEDNPTIPMPLIAVILLVLACGCGCIVVLLVRKRKKKEEA